MSKIRKLLGLDDEDEDISSRDPDIKPTADSIRNALGVHQESEDDAPSSVVTWLKSLAPKGSALPKEDNPNAQKIREAFVGSHDDDDKKEKLKKWFRAQVNRQER